MTDLFWIGTDLIFDFGISLFMFTTITMYANFKSYFYVVIVYVK